jgi:hypothetical protein
VAAAALTKFLPALLALQFLGVRRGRWRYALALVAALAAMLAWPLITSGPARFFGSTLGYQLIQRGGGVQFSIWTFMPHVAIVARPVLAAALVLVALSPVVRPPVRDPREHAALAAALLIGAQLLLGYWFYSYLTWCYPLLVIAIIQAPSGHEAIGTSAHGTASAPDLAATARTDRQTRTVHGTRLGRSGPGRHREDDLAASGLWHAGCLVRADWGWHAVDSYHDRFVCAVVHRQFVSAWCLGRGYGDRRRGVVDVLDRGGQYGAAIRLGEDDLAHVRVRGSREGEYECSCCRRCGGREKSRQGESSSFLFLLPGLTY